MNIKCAYDRKNKKELNRALDRIAEVKRRLKKFIVDYQEQWMKENKPFGFEVQHIRLGGLLERLKYAEQKIKQYVNGKIVNIDELEEDRLPSNYNTDDYKYNPFVPWWKEMVTCGRFGKL